MGTRLIKQRVTIGAALSVLFALAALAAQQERVFRGVVVDTMCATPAGDTLVLRPGETMTECTIEHAKKGAKFVLVSSGNGVVYPLDDQAAAKKFAARMVVAIGNLDEATGTIHVADLIQALPAKAMQAKSVYLDCGACAGGLAKAKPNALLRIEAWKRFTVVPERQKGDLIFRFSTGRYSGDFDTGKGPVSVDAMYMSVVDPATEQILWSGWTRSGYMLLSHAAADLIDQFSIELEAQEGHLEPLLEQERNKSPSAPARIGK